MSKSNRNKQKKRSVPNGNSAIESVSKATPAPPPVKAQPVNFSLAALLEMEGLGTALSVGAGLLFLALCTSLPLVGKAATHGSGSPGAGPIPSLGANLAWFWGLWAATTVVTAGAIARWGSLHQFQWKGLPRHLCWLAGLLLLLAVAQPAGWLAL